MHDQSNYRLEDVQAELAQLTDELAKLEENQYIAACSNNYFELSGDGAFYRATIKAKRAEIEAAQAVFDWMADKANAVKANAVKAREVAA